MEPYVKARLRQITSDKLQQNWPNFQDAMSEKLFKVHSLERFLKHSRDDTGNYKTYLTANFKTAFEANPLEVKLSLKDCNNHLSYRNSKWYGKEIIFRPRIRFVLIL